MRKLRFTMRNILFLTAMMLCATSCTAQGVVPSVDLSGIHNDVVVTCISKQDNSRLEYLKSKRVDIKSAIFADFIISDVTDVYGVAHTVNQTEWTNLACTEKVLP